MCVMCLEQAHPSSAELGPSAGRVDLRGILSTYRKSTSAKIITELFSSSENRTLVLHCMRCVFISTEITLTSYSCLVPGSHWGPGPSLGLFALVTHQQRTRVPVFPHLYPHLLFSVFYYY